MSRLFGRGAVSLVILAYTVYSLGPFLWLATMSGRTTGEISADHYAWPRPFHWEPFRIAWVEWDFATYFCNWTIVVVSAVALVTLVVAAAAHALARYRFPGNRLIYGILFSS